jgi:hypothetical protein
MAAIETFAIMAEVADLVSAMLLGGKGSSLSRRHVDIFSELKHRS